MKKTLAYFCARAKSLLSKQINLEAGRADTHTHTLTQRDRQTDRQEDRKTRQAAAALTARKGAWQRG